MICDEAGIKRKNYYCNIIFDQRNYDEISDEDMKELLKYWGSILQKYRKMIVEKRNLVEDYVIKVMTKNVELYSHITLPKRNRRM